MNPFHAGIFRAFHLDGGARLDEARGNFREIFHGRAEDGNFAKGGGLENIVATGFDERATDEGAIGEAIKRGEFADAVEQNDGGVVGDAVGVAARLGSDPGAGNGQVRSGE